MTFRTGCALSVIALLTASIQPSAHAAASAPEALRNHTFTVSWTEDREQREGSGSGFKQVSIRMQMTVYVSSAGRPFSKLIAASRSASIAHDSVGSSGSSLGNGSRAVTFSGAGIHVTSNFGGAARVIDIDASGGSCSAQVHVAKLQGASTVSFSRTDGRSFEVRSLSASSATCGVSSGNGFAR